MVDLDLAELLLLAPAEDAESPIPISSLPPVDRFVEGLCRAVGAIAGCIVVPGESGGFPEQSQAIGLAARTETDRAAMRTLIDAAPPISRRGFSWIREAATPDHCGLIVATGGADRDGHLILAFARDHLEDPAVTAQLLTLAPGLGVMAGAMRAISAERDQADRRRCALEAALQQSECGVVIISADQTVLFANASAQAILDSGDGMELRRNALRPTRYHDAVRFHAALDAVVAPPRHRESQRERGAMLLLERTGAERPLIAVIAPANRGHASDVGAGGDADAPSSGAAAIVRLMRPETSFAHGFETICQLHGLSPVETQLVASLARGMTLGEAATSMRIKTDTARTYLKQVFAKTDMHRQTDLLQLFLRYQRAVSGEMLFDAA